MQLNNKDDPDWVQLITIVELWSSYCDIELPAARLASLYILPLLEIVARIDNVKQADVYREVAKRCVKGYLETASTFKNPKEAFNAILAEVSKVYGTFMKDKLREE